MPSDILKKLAALVEEARSGRCDDVKYGDNCGKCHHCLAWALDEDWAAQLQASAPVRVEVCPHCGRDEGVCKYLGEHIAE